VANRLAGEVSPYLRQHAENPVDWFPWGEEAFARAAAEDRPVLLSVGYAACHWCHVMAHESFEDPAIAALCNAHFVAIKVDREEHPDVDALYQGICQAVTGQGGWPLTVFLTPDLRPFHVGTYFPPRPRYGRPGFGDVLAAVARAWRQDRARLLEVASEWAGALHRLHAAAPGTGPAPGRELFLQGAAAIADATDPLRGGFGDAPKFPQAPALEVLLRAGGRAADRAVFTLRAMAAGGIRDHLGGGFHRYSVDAAWTVPHFEKMLYDNAVLVPLYLAAWQRTGDPELAAVARQVLDYLLSDLRLPGGGFASSEDADSPGPDGRPAEGAFYTWTPAEVEEALGDAALARAACEHFGVTAEGSFEQGRSVLRLGAVALPAPRAEAVAAALRQARAARPRPARDDKVLAGWNGLAVSAFAQAGRILDEPRYTQVARQTAEFLRSRLRDGAGLLRRHPAGPRPIPGTLEDYAFLAAGLLDLYEATLEAGLLGEAAHLTREALRRFWVPAEAAFRLTEAASGGPLPERPRDDGDGPVPAAQSAALLCLARLRPYLRDPACADVPAAVLGRCAEMMRRHPIGLASLLAVLDRVTDPLEVVLAVPEGQEVPAPWLEALRARHLPNLLLSRRAAAAPGLDGYPPAWAGREPRGGRPTLWVCRGETCAPPAGDWAEIEPLLP
jgi:uncharacterized protein YyaL (SSP411 family)